MYRTSISFKTYRYVLPKCPLTTVRTTNCPRRSRGYNCCSSALNSFLTEKNRNSICTCKLYGL